MEKKGLVSARGPVSKTTCLFQTVSWLKKKKQGFLQQHWAGGQQRRMLHQCRCQDCCRPVSCALDQVRRTCCSQQSRVTLKMLVLTSLFDLIESHAHDMLMCITTVNNYSNMHTPSFSNCECVGDIMEVVRWHRHTLSDCRIIPPATLFSPVSTSHVRGQRHECLALDDTGGLSARTWTPPGRGQSVNSKAGWCRCRGWTLERAPTRRGPRNGQRSQHERFLRIKEESLSFCGLCMLHKVNLPKALELTK